MRQNVPRSAILTFLFVPFLWLSAAEDAATQQATVTGQVTDARTLRPLAGAQVSLVGTATGTLTDRDGQFSLSVDSGTHTVRIQMLGYRTAEEEVTLASGATQNLTIQLTSEALALDQIVVTGTAGGTQRRAIGNVVATLDADGVMDRSPIRNVEQLLVGRTTGVRAQSSAGQVGTGSPVIIRGISTLTQGNDPIVYIDGVRMYSNPRDGLSQRGGANQSRLNDIHPADIESIEIIKGPAAATLYGTEASNGVIQIITKRGQDGTPQWDVSTRTGTNWMWNPQGKAGERCMTVSDEQRAQLPTGINLAERFPDEEFLPGTYCFNVYENERVNHTGALYGYGMLQSYNLAVRGGTDLLRYSSSISRTHDVGVVDWNWDKRTSARLNVEALLNDRLTVFAGGSYISGQTRLSERSLQTSAFHGIIRANAEHLFDDRRGWAQVNPQDMQKVEARNDVDRTNVNLELRYQPFDWTTHRFVVGLDRTSYDQWTLFPLFPEGANHHFGSSALGEKEFEKGDRRFVTVDYSASADFTRGNFSFQPAAGLQYYKTENASITAVGREFPAIPITTVGGGADRTAGETFIENATVGVYIQQMVGWNDRAFVTAAVRADDNSAFGVDFDAAIYPKLSATWVISEESFWNVDLADQFRLRAAWGAAGQQPDAFAASRLYSPAIGYQDQPALIPGAFGNPDLKPERGDELEVGFDASVLDGRVDLEFTHYRKRVKDAILNRPLPPSTGFSGSQIVNIGLLHAWGNELGVNVRLLESPRFSWAVDAQWTTTRNEIKDMGGLHTRANREGYPVQSHFGRLVLDGEIDENRRVLWAMCDGGAGSDGLRMGGEPVPCDDAPQVFQGPSQPTWQLGLGNTFTVFNDLRFYVRVDGNGGHYNTHNYGAAVGHRELFHVNPDPTWPLFAAYGETTGRSNDPLYQAGFLRLSEISASYDLPVRLVDAVGAQRGSMSLGTRNLMMLWTAQHGWSTPRDGSLRHDWRMKRTIKVWDPDIKDTSSNPGVGGPQTAMPPTASAILTLRFSF
jgi:TonB-dependent starch-binding outer membrane protein SusC